MNKTALILNYLYFALFIIMMIFFLLRNDYMFALNLTALSSFYLGSILLEKFTSFKLENYIRALIILTLVGHNLLGEYINLYQKSDVFDKSLHFFGTFSFSLYVYSLLTNFIEIQSSKPALFTAILVSFLGYSLGALFELVEFTFDIILDQKNQSGLRDTNLDLIADLVGAILAGIFSAKYESVDLLPKTLKDD